MKRFIIEKELGPFRFRPGRGFGCAIVFKRPIQWTAKTRSIYWGFWRFEVRLNVSRQVILCPTFVRPHFNAEEFVRYHAEMNDTVARIMK